MKSYGKIDFEAGGGVKDFVIDNGPEFPVSDEVKEGYMFYLTSGTKKGPYVHNGTTWDWVLNFKPNDEINAHTTFDPQTQFLVVAQSFIPGSTKLFVGGMRQKLGVDYVEVDTSTIQLISAVTVEMVDQGSNIVLDFQFR